MATRAADGDAGRRAARAAGRRARPTQTTLKRKEIRKKKETKKKEKKETKKMYVACLNLHFPGGALRERAHFALAKIKELPSPCVVLVQEACATTARVIASGTRATHRAFYCDGAAPILLTLVPLCLQASVRAVAYPAGLTRMRRTAHLVEFLGSCSASGAPRAGPAGLAPRRPRRPRRPLVVAHVHLESCASSARMRDAQAAWLRSEHGATHLAGDLNGLGSWRTHIVAYGAGSATATEPSGVRALPLVPLVPLLPVLPARCERLRVSPHPLCVYSLAFDVRVAPSMTKRRP
jgi:hypothetical protein